MRVLVAGVGNVLMSDDGFGVEVARRMLGRSLPGGVRVVDFGIRGIDLTYALLDGYDAAIVVDVAQRGGAPGTLYVIEPSVEDVGDVSLDTHSMHPARVLSTVRSMGGTFRRLRLVACEPATFGDGDPSMGLSAPVAAAVDPAVTMVETIVAELLGEEAAADA